MKQNYFLKKALLFVKYELKIGGGKIPFGKIAFSFLSAYLFVFSAQGQINWGTEGNIADSSSFIGTKNAACFRLKSNNLERCY